MARESITLTREELYERVWTEPMAVLAPKLGLSDVGLKKTCARLKIPSPPRGYWARLAAGQKIRRTPLPKLPEKGATGIRDATFYPRDKESAAPQPLTGPVADQARFEALPENALVAPEILEAPSPLVARTVVAMRKAKPDETGRLRARAQQILDVDVTLGTADRAMRILDTLIKGLAARGYPVSLITPKPEPQRYGATPEAGPPRTTVRIGEDDIAIRLSEVITRTQRPPARSDGGWEPKRYDYEATGRLVFEILETGLGTRCKWADGARQRMESMLNDIVVGLVETAEALRRRREAWAESVRQRAIEEEKRRAREREEHLEQERVRALDGIMRRWRKAKAVRDYVAAARATAVERGHAEHAELNAWFAWADGYAYRIDPMGSRGVAYHSDDHDRPHYAWGRPAEDNSPIW
jgi:hypothetical protein